MKVAKRHKVLAVVLVAVALFFGVVYASVRWAYRSGANEPQRSMAQDVAKDLDDGRNPQDLFKEQIDPGVNMAPFVVVYDKYGKPLAGSGYLDGSLPEVPVGVLAASKGNKTNQVVWQPADHVRIAAVSVEADNYYVLGGRSLFVVENKITVFTRWLVAAWLATSAVLVALYKLWEKKRSHPQPASKDAES
jgi:hypothetical protein